MLLVSPSLPRAVSFAIRRHTVNNVKLMRIGMHLGSCTGSMHTYLKETTTLRRSGERDISHSFYNVCGKREFSSERRALFFEDSAISRAISIPDSITRYEPFLNNRKLCQIRQIRPLFVKNEAFPSEIYAKPRTVALPDSINRGVLLANNVISRQVYQTRQFSGEKNVSLPEDSPKTQDGSLSPTKSTGAVAANEHEKKKESFLVKFKNEMLRYWAGTKLLGTEIKISFRLLAKLMSGKKLLRRERRQLKRTIADLGRLLPFIVILIVPFMELALPIVIKLFPNFLPSTFHTEDSIKLRKLNLQKTRVEAAKLIRASELERADKTRLTATSKVLSNFLSKINQKSTTLSVNEMVEIAKLFPNHITIQGLARSQLVNICRYLDIVSIGPDTILKALIQRRLNYLAADDYTIFSESSSSYTLPELKQICSSRGMRVFSKSKEELKANLDTWLDLSVKKKVPNALLILSNATEFVNDHATTPTDDIESKLQLIIRTIYNLPEDVLIEAKMDIKEAEGTATFEERLSFLKDQEEEIEKELIENEQRAETRSIPTDQIQPPKPSSPA